MATTLSDDLLQQRAQLSHLYEQQENITNNITGLKQVIATLEYAIQKEESSEEPVAEPVT
jgi:prefoldin subunit 5